MNTHYTIDYPHYDLWPYTAIVVLHNCFIYQLALESPLPFDLTFSFFPPFWGLAWVSPTGLPLLDSCLDDVLLLLLVVELELVVVTTLRLEELELRWRRCWTSWMLRLFLMSASRFQPNSVLIHLSPGERQSLPTKGMALDLSLVYLIESLVHDWMALSSFTAHCVRCHSLGAGFKSKQITSQSDVWEIFWPNLVTCI